MATSERNIRVLTMETVPELFNTNHDLMNTIFATAEVRSGITKDIGGAVADALTGVASHFTGTKGHTRNDSMIEQAKEILFSTLRKQAAAQGADVLLGFRIAEVIKTSSNTYEVIGYATPVAIKG